MAGQALCAAREIAPVTPSPAQCTKNISPDSLAKIPPQKNLRRRHFCGSMIFLLGVMGMEMAGIEIGGADYASGAALSCSGHFFVAKTGMIFAPPPRKNIAET